MDNLHWISVLDRVCKVPSRSHQFTQRTARLVPHFSFRCNVIIFVIVIVFVIIIVIFVSRVILSCLSAIDLLCGYFIIYHLLRYSHFVIPLFYINYFAIVLFCFFNYLVCIIFCYFYFIFLEFKKTILPGYFVMKLPKHNIVHFPPYPIKRI